MHWFKSFKNPFTQNNKTIPEEQYLSELRDIDIKSINSYSLKGIKIYARLHSVYDGDTCRIVFKYNRQWVKYSIRMEGYDTPEIRSKNPKEKKAAYVARDRLEELILNGNKDGICWVVLGDWDKYGRLLGIIYALDDMAVSVNDKLVQEGYGYRYDGGTKKKFGEF